MITEWKVFNFKSVRKETELKFAPLTIFAGANSSGKSTVLQSILLVAQTLSHKVSSRSVVLNGALTRLGQFDDLKSVDGDADQIVIGWTCRPIQDVQQAQPVRSRRGIYSRRDRLPERVSCEIAFDTAHEGVEREVTQLQPQLFSTSIFSVLRRPEGGDHSMTVRRASSDDLAAKREWIEAVDIDEPWGAASVQYEVQLDPVSTGEIRRELVSAQPVGCLLRHFLPERVALGLDLPAENSRFIVGVLTGEGPRGFPRSVYVDQDVAVPGPVVDAVLECVERVGEKAHRQTVESRLNQPSLFEGPDVALRLLFDALRHIPMQVRMEVGRELGENTEFATIVQDAVRRSLAKEENARVVLQHPLPGAIAEAAWYFDRFFTTSVRYLGPLRDEPKALYPLVPSVDPADVGLRGEHTAAVLELHKTRQIRYIPTSEFDGDEIGVSTATRTLAAAVGDWLQYLGVAEEVESKDKGKFGHELTVRVPFASRPHDLTHVGVGVSQVLPILVASLLAEPDTTLIFEQPELHLHPRVQTRLADFFLAMSQLGKQCIIETHSEYLISRIRFRTAAAVKKNPWINSVQLYFVERGKDGSMFREVDVNEYGAIVDWPDGFFDENEREAEAILRAAAAKRRLRKDK